MNPILPLNFYMPDAEPRVFGDTVYLYGSHDIYNSDNYCQGELYVAYAKLNDLSNFKLQNILTFEKSGHSFDEAGAFQAPDCIEYNGKYYLYDNRMKRPTCDVAVSNSPLGPFVDYGFIQNKDGSSFDLRFFDPAIFVDDDNRIYLYTGFCPGKMSRWAKLANPYSQVLELEQDMKTVKAGPFNLIPGPLASEGTSFESHPFFEASSLRKIDGKYYFIYSSELSHELAYAVSDNPISGFKFMGTLVSNANIGFKGNTKYMVPWGNTHGSIFNVGKDYYVVYHRQTTGRETSRQAMAEKIEFVDGIFNQAEMTSLGFGKPLCKGQFYNATIASVLLNDSDNPKLTVGIEQDKSNLISTFRESLEDSNIHYINVLRNTTVGYKYIDFNDVRHISLRLEGSRGYILFKQDLDGEAIAKIEIDSKHFNYDLDVNFSDGIKPLYIIFKDNEPLKFYEFSLN